MQTSNCQNLQNGSNSSLTIVENQVQTDLNDHERGRQDCHKGIYSKDDTPAYYEGWNRAFDGSDKE